MLCAIAAGYLFAQRIALSCRANLQKNRRSILHNKQLEGF